MDSSKRTKKTSYVIFTDVMVRKEIKRLGTCPEGGVNFKDSIALPDDFKTITTDNQKIYWNLFFWIVIKMKTTIRNKCENKKIKVAKCKKNEVAVSLRYNEKKGFVILKIHREWIVNGLQFPKIIAFNVEVNNPKELTRIYNKIIEKIK
jgi:hypothetical protein